MNFISGIADCHLPGLFSLVVSERESATCGMRRVFYAGPDCKMDLWDGADFRLKPHNHRQDIKLTRLFGDVFNVTLKVGPHGQQFHVWKYRFGSALINGEFQLERMEESPASIESKHLRAPLRLHWSEIHTVVAEPNSAWLVEEGEFAPSGVERCYSISHRLKLSSEGLYRAMSQAELTRLNWLVQGLNQS